MNILVVASEAVPFVKTGGLGDVVGALPKALARQGHRLKVCLPRYRTLNLGSHQINRLDLRAEIQIGEKSHKLAVECVKERRLPLEYYFLANNHFFGRTDLYRDPDQGEDYPDNDERFVFLCRGVLAITDMFDWKPDVIHVHDWQASLIPAYLRLGLTQGGRALRTKTVLTIHNLAYQGTFDEKKFDGIGLPQEHFFPTSPFEFYGQVNFLKAGIVYADKITTVSERYAQEIQTPELGCGLEGVLKERRDDLRGILNGVDYSVWSPSRDKKIPHNYHPANLSGKRMNKVELMNRFSLPVRDSAPLIGVISRLADQKGFDLFAKVADEVLGMNVQMIVLGTGDAKYHELFAGLERRYPDKIRACLTFDDDLAHWIEAAADMFLMPSQFEPCGLNQMYSLKYGTIPIVREVGGLADTVENFDAQTGRGTGFVFSEYTSSALMDAIRKGVETYRKKRVWSSIMKAGMKLDYSWDRSARKYSELFQQITGS